MSDPEPSGLDSKAKERKAFIKKGDSSKIYFIKLFPERVLYGKGLNQLTHVPVKRSR